MLRNKLFAAEHSARVARIFWRPGNPVLAQSKLVRHCLRLYGAARRLVWDCVARGPKQVADVILNATQSREESNDGQNPAPADALLHDEPFHRGIDPKPYSALGSVDFFDAACSGAVPLW